MYIYTHIHICTHTHTHTYIYMRVFTNDSAQAGGDKRSFLCEDLRIYLHTNMQYISSHTNISIQSYTCIYIYIYSHTCTHMQVYTHIYTLINTCIYICI